jgi:EmrB/QacA subfamily drug resistance transporter
MSRKTWTLLAVILGSSIVFLDGTVVNVALPQIGRELPRSFLGVFEGQSYVYYGYLLSLSSLIILAGALTDHLGRRKMFLFGLISFGITSVLCGIAWSLEALVAFRVLQGIAGAFLVPGSLAIINSTFKGEEQGRAFGLWAAGTSATLILGPPLGGALVSAFSWRAAFLINVPLIAIALWATVRHVQESAERKEGRFDWLGAAVVALAVGGLTFGPIRGEATDWTSPAAFISLAVGGAAAIFFPILMARRPDPLVPLDLFKSRNFSVANLSTLVIYGALYVTFQVQAIFAIGTLGYNELGYGLAGLIGPIFLTVLSSKFGKLAARHGPRMFMTVGPFIMGLGLLWFIRLPRDSEPWVAEASDPSSWVPPSDYLIDILPALLIFGFGLAVMVAPLTTAIMRSVPVVHSGLASAINNAISRVGPQLLGAVLFIVISSSFYSAMTDRVPSLDVGSTKVRQDVTPFNLPEGSYPEEVDRAARASSTDAFHLAALVTAGLCFAGAAINAVGIRNEHLVDAPEETSTS